MVKFLIETSTIATVKQKFVVDAPDDLVARFASQKFVVEQLQKREIDFFDAGTDKDVLASTVLTEPSGDTQIVAGPIPDKFIAVQDIKVGTVDLLEGEEVIFVDITSGNIVVKTGVGIQVGFEPNDFFDKFIPVLSPTQKSVEELCVELELSKIRIVTESLPEVLVGGSYNENLQQEGMTPPILWTVVSGVLPTGLVLDTEFGIVSGIPSVDGLFEFKLKATDVSGLFREVDLSILVPSPPVITSIPLLVANQGVSYLVTVTGRVSASGSAPITFSKVSGPAELSIDPVSGRVDFIPSVVGPVAVTLRATNRAGANDLSFTIVVS